MPAPAPEDLVRLLFEVHGAHDDRKLIGMMGLADDSARRVEVQAHRYVRDGDDVIAFGRLRIFDDGALADSPAAWRFTIRDGLVQHVEPYAGAGAVAA